MHFDSKGNLVFVSGYSPELGYGRDKARARLVRQAIDPNDLSDQDTNNFRILRRRRIAQAMVDAGLSAIRLHATDRKSLVIRVNQFIQSEDSGAGALVVRADEINIVQAALESHDGPDAEDAHELNREISELQSKPANTEV